MFTIKKVALLLTCLSLPVLAQVSKPDADGTTPLHWAVRSDDLASAQRLLRSGANPNTPNRYGITPLSLAATNGNAEMVQLLVESGADVKAKLPGGQTMLMTAARTGNPDVVRILLAHGANPNAAEDTDGETALMWAAAEDHPEAAKLLIGHGAELDVRSKALDYPQDRFGLEGVVTILPHGRVTALMLAARQGSLATARVLAEAGADLNLRDPDGTTAMVLAIINGHYDTAAMLAEKGADPNLADTAGMAALYAAVDMSTLPEVFGRPQRKSSDRLSAVDLMKVLLDHGADPNAQLKTPTLQRAHTPGERNLGAGCTPLMRAARNGDTAAMRLLLDRGADPTMRQQNGTTALMLAAGLGRGLGTFADEYAFEKQMYEAVQTLLNQHVDVNVTNDNGQTALHFAALSMDSVVRLLAENGANLEAVDKQGRTPLDMANGKGGPGRAGAAAVVRQSTVELLHRLMAERAAGKN